MRLNNKQIATFVAKRIEKGEMSGLVKSILHSVPMDINFKTLNPPELSVDKFKTVGKVKIYKRNSEEFVYANIKRLKQGLLSQLELEHGGKTLIHRDLQNTHTWKDAVEKDYKVGLHLMFSHKTQAGEPFRGLAKIMDVLAVKESLIDDLGGKVYLEGTNNANALHWERGFTNVKFVDLPKNPIVRKLNELLKLRYDSQMRKLFDKYKQFRKNGYDIRLAKNKSCKKPLEPETMVFPAETLKQRIKEANRIRYTKSENS